MSILAFSPPVEPESPVRVCSVMGMKPHGGWGEVSGWEANPAQKGPAGFFQSLCVTCKPERVTWCRPPGALLSALLLPATSLTFEPTDTLPHPPVRAGRLGPTCLQPLPEERGWTATVKDNPAASIKIEGENESLSTNPLQKP